MTARADAFDIAVDQFRVRVGQLLRGSAGLAVAGMLATGDVQAVPVAPGETVFMPGATLTDRPDLAGIDIFGGQLDVRVGHPIGPEYFFVGWQVRQQVVRSDTTGALVFSAHLVWSLNITPGDFLVDALWLDGWGDFATDALYRTDQAGDRGPTWATRSADGDRLDMDFGFPLVVGNLVGEPQENAYAIQVVTDATAFATTGVLTVVGRFSDRPGEVFYGRVDGLAVPVAAPVPEPATWATMALGVLALIALGHRGQRLDGRASGSMAGGWVRDSKRL